MILKFQILQGIGKIRSLGYTQDILYTDVCFAMAHSELPTDILIRVEIPEADLVVLTEHGDSYGNIGLEREEINKV